MQEPGNPPAEQAYRVRDRKQVSIVDQFHNIWEPKAAGW
jgi:hypothetical protein